MASVRRGSLGQVDDKTTHPVVVDMPEISKTHMGGTMRLGLRTTVFKKDCPISMLHRHNSCFPHMWLRGPVW